MFACNASCVLTEGLQKVACIQTSVHVWCEHISLASKRRCLLLAGQHTVVAAAAAQAAAAPNNTWLAALTPLPVTLAMCLLLLAGQHAAVAAAAAQAAAAPWQ